MLNPQQIDASRDYILNACLEANRTINEVQKDIDELNEKLDMPFKSSDEQLNVINFSFGKDTLKIDKNQFTFIANSFYNTLRHAENMEVN